MVAPLTAAPSGLVRKKQSAAMSFGFAHFGISPTLPHSSFAFVSIVVGTIAFAVMPLDFPSSASTRVNVR